MSLSDYSSAGGAVVEQRPPGFVHGYSFTLAAASGAKALNTRDLGYFTSADDPDGADRPILGVVLENDTASVATIHFGSSYNQGFPLAPGRSIEIPANRLGEIYVNNKDVSNAATVNVGLVAHDE